MLAIIMPSSKIANINAETTPIEIATADGGSESGDTTGEEGTGDGSGENVDDTPSVTFEGVALSTSVIIDEYLYSALLKAYKAVNSDYTGSTIYSDMFKDFTSLNLDNKGISSLAGMERLELYNLKSFSANLNQISEFSSNTLKLVDTDVFSSLSLAGNTLSSVNLSSYERLTYIDLSSNQLSSLDLSNVQGETVGTNVTINVANNNFDSMSDINLPTKRIGHIDLNIISNNISDIAENYFTDSYTMHIGVQGFKSGEIVKKDTKTNFVIYKTGIEGVAVEIYKTDGDTDILMGTYSDSNITNNYLKLDLPVGDYDYIYTLNGEKVTNINSRNDHTKLFLQSYEFGIIPQKVNYSFTYKGEDYDTLGKVTGKVTVNLASEENAKIFYQVNGGEWIEGNTVECDKGGNYTIKVKTVINGFESEEESIWVRTSLNLYIPDALMLVLVLLLALVLFLVVLPIISKKYFKKD